MSQKRVLPIRRSKFQGLLYPLMRPAILVLSDLIALSISFLLVLLLKFELHRSTSLLRYVKLWPLILVFLASYWMSGLYSRLAISQPEDLERGTVCNLCIFLSSAAIGLSFTGRSTFFTVTFALCLLTNVFLMPFLREVCRTLFSETSGWSQQAVIFGAGSEAVALIERSRTDRGTGIRPVAVIDPAEHTNPFLCGLPIVSSIRSAALELEPSHPIYGILTVEAASSAEIVRLINSPESVIFSRMVLMSNPSAFSSIWAVPLARRRNLQASSTPRTNTISYRLVKRIFDCILAALALLLCLPLMILTVLLIKLDSPGPWLFGHKRIGKDQATFQAWKFRTMKVDGDLILAEWFQNNASATEEWFHTGKLRTDPRVTRIGKFLRSTSLDELPQLWNVIRGEMSLVGPRPIVEAEIQYYGEDYKSYLQVQSGVTGMWQVSGRSSTGYKERVMLDAFYVSNWTIWLDFAILLRTVGAVILRKGAV